MKQRHYYKEMLIYASRRGACGRCLQVSADFSDVRDLEAKSDLEIEEIMKDLGLPLVGTRASSSPLYDLR